MSWPKTFVGTLNTDIDAAGIGASKVSGSTGIYKLTGWSRAYRASANVTTFYQFSDAVADKNCRAALALFVDSTTLVERIGVTMRDTSTNATTGRNKVHFRLRTESSTAAFLEIFGVVGGSFPGTPNASAGFTIAANTNYTFICEANNDVFTIYAADGVTVLCGPVTISDAVLQNPGKIGLYSSSTSTAATAGASDGGGTGTHIVSVDLTYLNADVTASGSPAGVTITAPTGTASAAGGDVTASGAPDDVVITAPTGAASAGNPLAIAEFFGSNVSLSASTVTNGSTSTPIVNIVMRNPEGGTPIWQHVRFCLVNDSSESKTATVNIDLANEESGTNTVRSTWPGPYRANTLNDIDAWTAIARSATGGILTFSVPMAPGETVYICSMPPGIRPQAEDWIAKLVAAYPTLIHDDVPSRVALGSTAYKCDTAPTVADELGRTISGEPMMAFRIGNDAVGVPALKPEICLFSMLHPGEDHGFIQLRGCVDKLLSDATYATLRNSFNFVVRPIGAPNGTKGGYRRYEPRVGFSDGDNLNREWKPSTLNQTAQKWQALLNTDHGASFSRVRALVDFHDLSAGSQVAFYYYRAESPNLAALRAVVEAAIPGIASQPSTNDSTTTDYFINTKGVGPAMTAEVSDQAASLAGYMAVGAGWAATIKGWFEAGLLGVDASGAAPTITVSAPTGNASAGGADVTGGGTPSPVAVSAPTGNATAGGSDVTGGGAPSSVTVSAPTGTANASSNVTASGVPPGVNVAAPSGRIEVPAGAGGTPDAIETNSPEGQIVVTVDALLGAIFVEMPPELRRINL
ncbi:hypothetical protein HPT27_10560 [Permianibacter sp. IMCC34836]|uniref:M14 family zinc carboxypeptidase n=1 Tax=Permianibacter fluminis TaxID=2738515 RepID=UPI001551C6BD|nr:M14 family zinc carboxypeptidase [Permianibacter fluminis]NQD37469.1 hypothetical protein [Permianibacter fluminis]